jgi:dipeptidyl-peptidase III
MVRLTASYLDKDVVDAMTAIPPFSLGFPGKDAQSQYYPGPEQLQRQEILTISRLMEQKGVYPENTRLRKDLSESGETTYTVMLASTEDQKSSRKKLKDAVFVEGGDHKNELSRICEELQHAALYAANETQKRTIELYIKSFTTGELGTYKSALESWVHDLAPKVEHIIGFVEPYRDPYGVRAEFEGMVAIADPGETAVLRKLVEHSDKFIRGLPWSEGQEENNGKGPFEKSLFEPPDFSSIHGQ